VITEGDTTTITCEAVGYPPPTIGWSRTSSDRVSVSDSVSVPTGNGNVTSVSVNLTLTNANREDSGLYECSASNSVGSDNRNTSVTVQCKLHTYYFNVTNIKQFNIIQYGITHCIRDHSVMGSCPQKPSQFFQTNLVILAR